MRLRLKVLLLAAIITLLPVQPSARATPPGEWHIEAECKTNGTCTVCSYYRVYNDDGFTVYLYSDVVCTP